MRRHSGMLQASLCLLLVGASFLIVQAQENGYPRYSPCAPPILGDPFVVGIAYWPGGTVLQWGGATTDQDGKPGLNPCLADVYVNGSVANYQEILNENNVYFSTYSMSVDSMTALRTTKLEEDLMFALAKQSGGEQVISAIAFRGNIRSEAQYIRSASSVTGGQGVVQRLGLIVTLDNGNLTNLNWYNFDGCNECGGADSSSCIRTQYDPVYQVTPQESCATSLTEAECTPCTDKECKSANCSTTYMTAFRGSSKSGQSLQSAYQLEAAFKFSIYDILGGIFNDASELGSLNVGPLGQGVSGGSGSFLTPPTPAALPLPGGEISDEQLAAAQNGEVLPTSTQAPVIAEPTIVEPTPVPVQDPTVVPSTDPEVAETPFVPEPVPDPVVPIDEPIPPTTTDYPDGADNDDNIGGYGYGDDDTGADAGAYIPPEGRR
ncbi:hypothetical protein Ndes2437B_g03515 [Nannochloris sp. 'desiccata']